MDADAIELREAIRRRYAAYLAGAMPLEDVREAARAYQARIAAYYRAKGLRTKPPSVAALIRQVT